MLRNIKSLTTFYYKLKFNKHKNMIYKKKIINNYKNPSLYML